MDKQTAVRLAESISNDIESSNTFSLIKHQNKANSFEQHMYPHLGAFLISGNRSIYWIVLIEWNNDSGNYYVLVFPEKSPGTKLAELHKVEQHADGFDLYWKYKPIKHDDMNEDRKHIFQEQFGSLEARISLPSTHVELDEFLSDIFILVDCRRRADDLDEVSPPITRATFAEGKRLEKKHKSIERSPRLVALAKQKHANKNEGRLPCEVCEFDFYDVYGNRGVSYIEAHHKVPLSKLDESEQTGTQISDLAMVCANCHRMLHRRPSISIEEMRATLRKSM